MKKLFPSLLALALASGIVLSTAVAAAPPWAGKGGAAILIDGQHRPPTPPTRLGIAVATLTPEIAERLGIDYQEGVVVVQVRRESPAAVAGLGRGEIVTAADGTPVATVKDLKDIVKDAGDQVTLTVVGKGDIVVDLSQAFPPRRPGKGGMAKRLPSLWPLRLLKPEMEGVPSGERFSHIMGGELRVTDKDGGPHTLKLIPGTVVSVSGDTLTLLSNEDGEQTYIITDEVKGHQLLERLEEGQKLIVATVDGSVRAIFPPRMLWGHPQQPMPRPLFRFEGGAES